MKRRQFIKAGAVASAGVAAVSGQVTAAHAAGNTAFVLVHGSWHGGWCWDLVEQELNAAGHYTVAIDLPGHGLNAALPEAFLSRPLDAAKFATEPSALASIGIDAFADAVIDGADRALAAGASNVVAVGHSMGGVPITFAAAKQPEKFAGLAYVAALAPTPGKPAGAYLQLEDQHNNSKIGSVIMADPAAIGALRMDPRSTDADYLAAAKEALAADVDDALLASVMHMLTPDAPVAMYGEVAEFAGGFEALKRSYIRCTADQTVMPSTCEAIVADMNTAWPESKTSLVDIDSSHEVMFSKPKELAQAIIASV
jgi:pimeloyl-ACP methyl ester carboxylesterase